MDHYVQKEIDRRSDMIIKALEKLEASEKDRDSIKPDQQIMDAAGKELQTGYSKPIFDKLKKAKERVEKLTKALNGALDGANYEALEKVLK